MMWLRFHVWGLEYVPSSNGQGDDSFASNPVQQEQYHHTRVHIAGFRKGLSTHVTLVQTGGFSPSATILDDALTRSNPTYLI